MRILAWRNVACIAPVAKTRLPWAVISCSSVYHIFSNATFALTGKKRPRPVDQLGQSRAALGHWLPGRGMVESLCLATHAGLAGRRPSRASGGAGLEKGRP